MRKMNRKAVKTIETISEQITDISNYKIVIASEMKEKYINDIFSGDRYTVYVKPGVYAMSTKKIESLIRLAEIQRYYQCNPVRFIDDWFNIELLDAQAYIVQRSWVCPNVLLVCSRG